MNNRWLRKWCDEHGEVYAIKVRGDSMHPTFQNGDIVLVNHGIKDIYDGYIYAININIDEEVIPEKLGSISVIFLKLRSSPQNL